MKQCDLCGSEVEDEYNHSNFNKLTIMQHQLGHITAQIKLMEIELNRVITMLSFKNVLPIKNKETK